MNATMTAAKPVEAGIRVDLIAGLTAAAVVLPKAMAYATVAGLPVAVGLYTAFVPMVVYALLGSSRVLSNSSTATLAILVGTQLGVAVPGGDPAKLIAATATLSALVGALLIVARVLKLDSWQTSSTSPSIRSSRISSASRSTFQRLRC